MKFSISVQFMHKGNAAKGWMMLYTILTGACYLLDALCFLIVFRWFSTPGNEHSELLLMMVILAFLVLDVYYLVWVINIRQRLPGEYGAFVSDAILGYSKKMTRELFYNLDRTSRAGVESAREKLASAKNAALEKAKAAKEAAAAKKKQEAQNKKNS